MARPFRVPGGLAGAVFIAVPPTVLLAAAVARNVGEQGLTTGFLIGLAIVAIGPMVYVLMSPRQ